MSHVSDSDHRRLEAKVFADHCVVESHEISDVSRGLRRVPITRVWRTERLLGQGGFGEVHLQSQEGAKDAKRALKIIPTRGVKLSLADCQRELTAMIEFTKPKYRNAAVFVEFIGWFQTDDAMFLAMEYMPLGDLEKNLKELEKSPTNTGSALPEEDVQEISRQILEGLKIMHAEGFAHRDLKPQNVFVVQREPQWWVKLGDFGLSKKRTEGTAFRTQAGTQQYMAPELFLYVEELDTDTSEYTNAIDLWALGCIIYRILTGAVPFPSLLSLKNYSRDPVKAKLNMPATMASASEFVGSLLTPHPGKRPAATAALESTWLTIRKMPTVAVNDIGASFSMLNISQSQNNYNTTSHKGLQSNVSVPATNSSRTDSTTKETVPEPLPVLTSETLSRPHDGEDQSKPQDYSNKWGRETVTNLFGQSRIPGLEPPAFLRHRSTSQPTRPATSALPKKSSSNELQAKVNKPLSEQSQMLQDQIHPTKGDRTISTIPAFKSKPPPLAKPVPEPDSTYGEVQSHTEQVTGNDVDSYRFHAPTDKVPTGPVSVSAIIDSAFTEVVEEASGTVDAPDLLLPVPPTRKPRSIIGEVIPDLPNAVLSKRIPLAPVERSPPPQPQKLGSSKKSRPVIPIDRGSMPITEIKLIFDSYGIPYHESFTRLQLLDVLNGTFPASGAHGRPFYYDATKNTFSWKDPRGSLPLGWESYLSHGGVEYYRNKSTNFTTWQDPRISRQNASVKPHSENVPLEQRINRKQLPSSGRKPPETETVHPPKRIVQLAAAHAPNATSYVIPDMPADMQNAPRLSYTTPQRVRFWMKALYDFDPQIPSDLRFSKGDIIRVVEGKVNSNGWLVGELNGRRGSFPSNYCQLVVWMRALYDFDPQYEGDLRLSARDLIEIKDVENHVALPDGWLVGVVNGRKGMFPANYCDVVTATPGPETNGQAPTGSMALDSNVQPGLGSSTAPKQHVPKTAHPSPQAHVHQPYSSSASSDAHLKYPPGPSSDNPRATNGGLVQPAKRVDFPKDWGRENSTHVRMPIPSESSGVVSGFPINIHTPLFKFEVRVKPKDTIEAVKHEIKQQTGYREESFFLTFKWKHLNNSATIADYGIQLHDTILLNVLRTS